MANPQPDQFTRISNELMEKIPRFRFNGTQLRIIFVIFRFTYGFNRKEADLSLKFIAEATEIHRMQIKRELDHLIDSKVIKVTENLISRSKRNLSFNKDYDQWNLEGSCMDEKIEYTQCAIPTLDEMPIVAPLFNLLEKDILEYWNSFGITSHKESKGLLKIMKESIKKNTFDQIKSSIKNYVEVYSDQSYYYSHAWRLEDFLKQKNGVPHFTDDGKIMVDYSNRKKQPSNKQKSKAERIDEL